MSKIHIKDRDTIAYVKTKRGETLMGQLIYVDESEDDLGNLEIKEIQMVGVMLLTLDFAEDKQTGLKSIPFHSPSLFAPYSKESFITLKSSDWYTWDICSEYYQEYYASAFTELSRYEKAKQEMVMSRLNAIKEAEEVDSDFDDDKIIIYADPETPTTLH